MANHLYDMLIATGPNREEHFACVRECLQILQENNLFITLEKCTFFTTKIELLRFIIDKGRIEMDQMKLKGTINWPIPTTLKQLRSFLGFCNFYHQFMKDYANHSK